MGGFSQTQITALIAALACVMALITGLIHDRTMAERAAKGEPWVKPRQPLALLAMATLLSVMTAILALQGR
jgi:hypothetical protein